MTRLLALACALGALSCGGSVAGSAGSDAGADAAADSSVPDGGSSVDGGGGDGPVAVDTGGGGCTTCECANCADQSLQCDPGTAACVECLSDQDCKYEYNDGNPNEICLPSHECGCDADSQCVGQLDGTTCIASLHQCGCNTGSDCSTPGALTCAPNQQCGCTSNMDCLGDGGALEGSVCNPATGACVQCVADSDCKDPSYAVCEPSAHLCLPCRTDTDCALNDQGPVCQDFGQFTAGYGACGCTTDSQCPGRMGGPHCVSNGSPYDQCGCTSASDCAGNANGTACVNPYSDGWMECGCSSAGQCPSGKSCMAYVCE